MTGSGDGRENYNKKLSVIIPLYNVEEHVHRAAESIVRSAEKITNTMRSADWLEVVLVDDGSTDRSLEVCLECLAGVDTIVIQQENAGLSVARNEGIFAATGEYIMFLDGDDFLLPDAFKNILSLLENSQSENVQLENEQPDVIFGRYICWSPDTGFSKAKKYNYHPPDDPKKRTEYIINDLPEPAWNAWRYICRRKAILERELFFERGVLCEDVPWSLNLLENVDTIAYLAEPFYVYYRQRPNSIMNQTDPKRLIDLNSIICGLLKQYNDRPRVYRRLVWQSFFYINEYCAFEKHGRRLIWDSYREVLPLYSLSESWLHRAVGFMGKCWILFYGLSAGMFGVKCMRRWWKYGLGEIHGQQEQVLSKDTLQV